MITETTNGININGNQLSIDCITSNQDKFQLDSEGNLTVNSITMLEGNTGLTMNFDSIYPIGSIYMNTTNVNLGILFGGTWEQIKDRFLLGAGNSYPLGSIGGEADHILAEAEMPRHNHKGIYYNSYEKLVHPQRSQATNVGVALSWVNGGTYKDSSIHTGQVGGNQPHNNMPPYLTVYIWKRIS